MYSKEEQKDAIREVLAETDCDGKTVVEQSLDVWGAKLVTKMTWRFGVGFVAIVISSAGAWYSLSGNVAANTKALSEGGRYTQEEHNAYVKSQEQKDAEQDRRIEEQSKTTAEQFTRLDVKLDNVQATLLDIVRSQK